MFKKQGLDFLAISIVGMAAAIGGVNAWAHTTLELPSVPEGARSSNNIIIGHGCGERNVIGTSVVFPTGEIQSKRTIAGLFSVLKMRRL